MAHGRFAPSPTGRLHVGNLRTALLAWLFARSAGGRFTMRVEDLDPQRSKREHEAQQLEDLRAIGLDWDGDVVRQSERTGLYRAALERLRDQGRVYPCWCSRAEVRAAAGAPHDDLPEGAYPGTCRGLSAAEGAERERQTGRPPSLRLDARGQRIEFADLVHGPVAGVVDDIVLWRGDDTPAYNLAVVVDDADQGIDQVVRGDDLLDTTPRQLLLARLLELPAPAHAHVPLVLGEDGERLAKRHGAVTLEGIDSGDAVAWIARSLSLDPERDLIEQFDPARLPREPATFIRGS